MSYIPFNIPHLSGNEIQYIQDALKTGKISGNGKYTQFCQKFFEKNYGFGKCLLTTSCTDALEMAALLLDVEPGDEVILPSFTFVSTANAFVLRGAKLVFVDSRKDHPGFDEDQIEELITSKTKVIVPVHYSGVACDMDKVMSLAKKYNLYVVEDAAHAIDSYYTGKDGVKRALGSIGHLAAFSFHETKNISSGEGGMLVVNDGRFMERAEVIWEKGTNRSAFFRGEIDKYGWMDIGSSFLPSEMIAAFLWGQLENLEDIQRKRLHSWHQYQANLEGVNADLPYIPDYATNNAHLYYIKTKGIEERESVINHLKFRNIMAVFHYQSLHQSAFYRSRQDGNDRQLPNAEFYTNSLIRLPLYYDLSVEDVDRVTQEILQVAGSDVM